MVVAMMKADVRFPDRPRKQYTSSDIARHQDILMAATYILNICIRGEGLSGWVSTGVYPLFSSAWISFSCVSKFLSLAESHYRVGW